MKSMPRATLAIPVLVLPVLLLLAVLAACGAGGTSNAASSASGGSTADVAGSPDGTVGSEATAPDDASAKNAAAMTPMSRAVISTGQVTAHSASLGQARSEVLRLTASWGGTVADEQSESDRRGRLVNSTLTLRVPTPAFSRAMESLARIGTVEEQTRASQDVTTKVLDNDARVRAGERAVRQVEALLGRAERLSDVIAIESDLARRQADLDSLKSQQAWLADQTSLSTITVSLHRTPAAAPGDHETRGFLAGLDNGWGALKDGTQLLLTGAGALLPFGVILVLLGAPLWVVVRRRASAVSAPARSA